MTENEKTELAATYEACRKKELQILSELEKCNFDDDDLFRLLAPVQQERAKLARMLQIDL